MICPPRTTLSDLKHPTSRKRPVNGGVQLTKVWLLSAFSVHHVQSREHRPHVRPRSLPTERISQTMLEVRRILLLHAEEACRAKGIGCTKEPPALASRAQ